MNKKGKSGYEKIGKEEFTAEKNIDKYFEDPRYVAYWALRQQRWLANYARKYHLDDDEVFDWGEDYD